MNDDPYAIGCDVGVTHVKLVTVSAASGEVLTRRQTDTLAKLPDWPTRVRDAIVATEQAYGPAAHVGLAAPGIAAPDGRRISWMRGRLAEVEGLDWTEFLGQPVPVLNDAQAALLGEVWQGAARGASNVLLLTLGTGVGGAAMVDGRLLKGHLGRAGHVGHISMDPKGPRDIANTPGRVEDRVGNATIAARTKGRYQSTLELVEAFREGDTDARTWWRETVDTLAAGIASLVNVLDPEVVIIGGGVATAGEALFALLGPALARVEWRPHGQHVRVVPAALGEYAGAIGAARNAISGGTLNHEATKSRIEP